MNRYIDIRLRPDPDFPSHQLMSALYSKLHHALVQFRRDDIGVSFPDLSHDGKRLGHCLRLHSTTDALQHLAGGDWLAGMRDHVQIGNLAPVPETTLHRPIRRVQVQSSAARLRRRLIRRKGISEQEALQHIPDSASRQTTLPFVLLRSRSTAHAFPLFIEHGAPQEHPVDGPFNTYGLSQTATVPWF